MNYDDNQAEHLLKTVSGQANGIIRMLDDGRDFPEVSAQIHSLIALLKKADGLIIQQKVYDSIQNAIDGDNREMKIKKLTTMIAKSISEQQ